MARDQLVGYEVVEPRPTTMAPASLCVHQLVRDCKGVGEVSLVES